MKLGFASITSFCSHLRVAAQWLTAFVPLSMIGGQAVPEVLIGLIVGAFLLDSFLRRDWRWLRNTWFITLSVLWAYLVIRGVFSIDSSNSVGRALPWIHYPLFAVALTSWILTDEKVQQRLLNVLIITVIFLVVDTLFQYITGHDLFGRAPTYMARLQGPFDRPRVGIVITWTAFPVLLYFASRLSFFKELHTSSTGIFLRHGTTALAVITGTLLAVYLSGERMAFLLCLAGCGAAFLLSRRSRWMVAASVVLGLGIMFMVSAYHPELKARQISQSTDSIANYWQTAYGQVVLSSLRIWESHPLTGVGLKNFRVVCSNPEYGPTTPEALVLRCPMHPHQIYMEWLAEAGILGFGLFCWVLGQWGSRCYIARQKILEDPVLTGLFITALIRLWPLSTATSQFIPWSAAPFWLLTGFLLARLETE